MLQYLGVHRYSVKEPAHMDYETIYSENKTEKQHNVDHQLTALGVKGYRAMTRERS